MHFWRNAFRWDERFDSLITPLRQNRSIELTTTLIETAPDHFYTHTYSIQDIDIILLEGIFLFKRELRGRYDLTWWVECSFETALRRALARNQEGLSESEIVVDYETIYFPAQRHHLAVDEPTAGVNGIFENDGLIS